MCAMLSKINIISIFVNLVCRHVPLNNTIFAKNDKLIEALENFTIFPVDWACLYLEEFL